MDHEKYIKLINDTLSLTEKVEEKIDGKASKENVFILGNSGSGRSTFTQWISGHDDKLEAIKNGTTFSDFIIVNRGEKASKDTSKSDAVFPNLITDTESETTFWDCPGFSDIRNTSIDIANAHFIKKILDRAKKVKLVFLVDYSLIKEELNRDNLLNFFRKASDLIKNFDRFKKSIGIVLTKVPRETVAKEDYDDFFYSPRVLTDSEIISNAAQFLQEGKTRVENDPRFSAGEVKKILKFIDLLLSQEDEIYTKIGIFRKVPKLGLLSDIRVLRQEKEYTRNIILKNLDFTQNSDSDFGYALSTETKNDIKDMNIALTDKIEFIENTVVSKVQGFYHDLVQTMLSKIYSFLPSKRKDIIYVNQTEAETFSHVFIDGLNVSSNFKNELSNLTDNPTGFANKFKSTVLDFGVKTCDGEFSEIRTLTDNIEFLKKVSNEKLNIHLPTSFSTGIITELERLRIMVKNNVTATAAKISTNLIAVKKRLHDHYEKKMRLLPIQNLPDELGIGFNFTVEMTNLTETVYPPDQLGGIMQKIYDDTTNSSIKISWSNVQLVKNQIEYSKYLQKITIGESPTFNWVNPFKEIAGYLSESQRWYMFLNSLYLKFSEYDLQNNFKSQHLDVVDDFQLFLSKVHQYNVSEYDFVKNLTNFKGLTSVQSNDFKVFSLNLKYIRDITIKCEDEHLFIEGEFVSIKDIVNETRSRIFQDCKNLVFDELFKSKSKLPNVKTLKMINILASNTIFIDESIKLNPAYGLAILAPKWEVIGNKITTIDLDGEPAGPSCEFCSQLERASKPGLPGGPGGNFFGIGNEFINGKSLTVSVNGGAGGKGEDGCNGANGETGKDHGDILDCSAARRFTDNLGTDRYYKEVLKKEPLYNGRSGTDYRQSSDCATTEKDYPCTRKHPKEVLSGDTMHQDYLIHDKICLLGENGSEGVKGDDGGSKGRGGYPGQTSLFELDKASSIINHNAAGPDGEDGKAGRGGYNGQIGQTICFLCKRYANGPDLKRGQKFTPRAAQTQLSTSRAPDGINGNNRDGMKNPIESNKISNLDKALILNKFKSLLREKLTSRYSKFFILEFVNKLNSNENLEGLYDTDSLVDELKSLEKQAYYLHSKVDFAPLYQTLLNRIRKYATGIKENQDLNKAKMILGYLYAASLGRIANLLDSSESNLVVDVYAYLDSINKEIGDLKDLKDMEKMRMIVEKYTVNYRKNVEQRIDEAKKLMKNTILPEIDSFGARIDGSINSLIDKVINLKKKDSKNKTKLKEAENDLANELIIRNIFSIVKIISGAADVVIFGEEIVLPAMDYESTSLSTLLLNPGHTTKLNETTSQKIEEQLNLITNFQKKDPVEHRLNNFIERLSLSTENNQAKSVQINDIKKKFSEIPDNQLKRQAIKALEDELKSVLQKTEDQKTTQSTEQDEEGEQRRKRETKKDITATSTSEDNEKFIEIGEGTIEVYNSNKNDTKKIGIINQVVEDQKRILSDLSKYQETIYDIIAPSLEKMRIDLDGIKNNTNCNVEISLNVTSWQITSSLIRVKLQMQKFTDQYEIKDDLLDSIKKLQVVIDELISIYKYIKEYHLHQEFSAFMTDLVSNSNVDKENQITDERLKVSILDLKTTICSSVIWQRYQVGVNALKQLTFPLGPIYMEETVLSSNLTFKDSFDFMITNVPKQIDLIKKSLKNYQKTVTAGKSILTTGNFTRQGSSVPSFFVWQNMHYSSQISNLFAGKEIILIADAAESPVGYDVIKFDDVWLEFTSPNKTLEQDFYDKIEDLKISMTHLGQSYYRYFDETYSIPENNQTFSRPLLHKSDQILVNNTITNSTFMLSPYGLWKMRIENPGGNFNLSAFEKDIDIHFGGHGYYVAKSNNSSQKHLVNINRYYKPADDYFDTYLSGSINHLESNMTTCTSNISINRYKRQIESKSLKPSVEEVTSNNLTNVEAQVNATKHHESLYLHMLPVETLANNLRKQTTTKDSSSFFDSNSDTNYEIQKESKNEKLQQKFFNSTETHAVNLVSEVITTEPSTWSLWPTESFLPEVKSTTLTAKNTSIYSNNLTASTFDGDQYDQTNNKLQARTSEFDVNGNLSLAQLIVHKAIGVNKSPKTKAYISPEEEKSIKVKRLALDVKKALDDFSTNKANHYNSDHNDTQKWYQNLISNNL